MSALTPIGKEDNNLMSFLEKRKIRPEVVIEPSLSPERNRENGLNELKNLLEFQIPSMALQCIKKVKSPTNSEQCRLNNLIREADAHLKSKEVSVEKGLMKEKMRNDHLKDVMDNL